MPGATDNYVGNPGTGGESYASDAIVSVHYPRVKIAWGVDGAAVDASATNPFPVTLTSTTVTGTVAVTGTFWQATQPVSIAGTVAVSGPLTDAQLRLTAVPVTMTSTTVTGSVAVTGTFWQATQPVSGTVAVNTISGFATETTAAAINATLTAGTVQLAAGGAVGATPSARAVQVSGSDYGGTPLSRAIKVDAAGAQYIGNFPATQAVSGIFWQTTQPVSLTSTTITGTVAVTGTFFQATQPVSIASMPTTPVTGTFFQATQPVSFTQPVLVAGAAIIGKVGIDQTTPGTTNAVALPTSTLAVTATAAVNTAATASLPAAGAGLFHYITSIQVMKLYSVVGVAAGAGVIITSTNLPGTPAWTTEQVAGPAGTVARVVDLSPTAPIRSSVANTITTIAAPAQLQSIWRINVTYYTGT